MEVDAAGSKIAEENCANFLGVYRLELYFVEVVVIGHPSCMSTTATPSRSEGERFSDRSTIANRETIDLLNRVILLWQWVGGEVLQ